MKSIFRKLMIALISCLVPIVIIVIVIYNYDCNNKEELLNYILKQHETLKDLGFSTMQLQGDSNTVLLHDNYGAVFESTALYVFNQNTKSPELNNIILYLDFNEEVPFIIETIHKMLQLANDNLKESQEELINRVTLIKNIEELNTTFNTKNNRTLILYAIEWLDAKYVIRIALVSDLEDIKDNFK